MSDPHKGSVELQESKRHMASTWVLVHPVQSWRWWQGIAETCDIVGRCHTAAFQIIRLDLVIVRAQLLIWAGTIRKHVA